MRTPRDEGAGHPHDVLDPGAHAARLRAFFVHPHFARRGLARNLLGVCEHEAAAAGFTRLELLATPTARPLYRACGFEDVERLTNLFPNGVAALAYRMAKTLAAAGAGTLGSGVPLRQGRACSAVTQLKSGRPPAWAAQLPILDKEAGDAAYDARDEGNVVHLCGRRVTDGVRGSRRGMGVGRLPLV